VIWRSEVYDVDLGRPVGNEPAFTRPAIVVSADAVSNSPGDLVAVVPIISISFGLRNHVEIDPDPAGLEHLSFARCDQLRLIATKRLERRRGIVSTAEIARIDGALRFVLDL
jgi:mRNA interferase MazF